MRKSAGALALSARGTDGGLSGAAAYDGGGGGAAVPKPNIERNREERDCDDAAVPKPNMERNREQPMKDPSGPKPRIAP